VALVLIVFNLRRLLFTVVAMARGASRAEVSAGEGAAPAVLILVSARDEASVLPGLFRSLAQLDYPSERLRVILIDDGSSDETHALMKRAVAGHSGWRMLHLESSLGKPRALNEALNMVTFGEVVVVYDADHRPRTDSLKRLVAVFDDPCVAGASGRTLPLDATASLPAFYAAVESLVHQLVTMQAKDRLNLAPALLGSNCAYRRDALARAGGFRPGALLEDSDLTLTLARSGYRLRFVPESIADHQVPVTVEEYVKQHLRWARGFNDAARDHALTTLSDRRLRWSMRLELALFALGYLDRLALLAALIMKCFDRVFRFPSAVLLVALITPFVQILSVFIAERAPFEMWVRLPAIPILFGLDVWAAVRAMAESLLDRPRAWTRTRRTRSPAARSAA
jgi:cellulose synthase/poly-beta-1,6-N-acetylglucosamine synthase-like glycosyltransferase